MAMYIQMCRLIPAAIRWSEVKVFFDDMMAAEIVRIHNEHTSVIDSFLENLHKYFAEQSKNEVNCIYKIEFILHACKS